jgi:hypothetical protein
MEATATHGAKACVMHAEQQDRDSEASSNNYSKVGRSGIHEGLLDVFLRPLAVFKAS